MLFIHFFALVGILLMCLCFYGTRRGDCKLPKYFFWLLFAGALILRLAAAALSKGFGTDTACFAAWADRIFTVGPGEFYSSEVFTDYPPGYMYVLWILGAVRSLFSMEYYSVAHLILLKLPAIACDMACGFLLLHESRKKCTDFQSFFLCLAYLLNPVVLLNSSIWGQVDAVFTLALAFMCLSLIRGKTIPAYIAFGIGVLIKPQTLIFAPVLLAGIIDWVFLKDFSVRKFLINLFSGIASICGMVLLCLPFGFANVWSQYFSTVGSYPYAAVNACNLWGLFGLNWVSQDNTFLGISYQFIGMAVIAAIVILVLFLSIRDRENNEKYPFLAAFLILMIFVFSVRMHERYMFPGLLMLLFAYIYRPSGYIFLCYGGFSAMHFYNTAQVLFFYDPGNYDRTAPAILLTSAGMLACAGFLIYTTWLLCRRKRPVQAGWQEVKAPSLGTGAGSGRFPFPKKGKASKNGQNIIRHSQRALPLKPADIIIMLAVTLTYSCFALYDLGDRKAPVTAYDMVYDQAIELDFGSEIPATLSYYTAPWHSRTFSLEGKQDAQGEWISLGEIKFEKVFAWQDISIQAGVPILRLTLKETQASLLELTFLDASGKAITPVNADQYAALFDEADLRPAVSSFRNSMYFDEIYHGRTAYEFLHGLTSYENTHPPLGKVFIALGVLLFGMNPFGWRIIGTLFGIAMVPLVYLFARRISESTPLASLACVMFTFDFMHFSQTRIATIDVYITFFVILMYYLMYQYSKLSFYDTPLWKTLLPLGACGVSMGLGIACKWTGVYAGAGLALIFFATLYRRYQEYCYAKRTPSRTTDGFSHKDIIKSFIPNTRRTILFCLVFFVAVPAVIYLLSYLPFVDYTEGRGLVSRMLHNQETMFNYHSTLNATHDYSSPWYEWPMLKRPIWYYSRIVTGEYLKGGLREGISSFGNPAVWWLSLPVALYMAYLWAKKKDRTAAFLLTGYLAQYLPWFFVTRITFIYHYFPSVVFVVMMAVYSLVQWKDKLPGKKMAVAAAAYGTVVVVLFLMFYPVLSGQPVEASYVDRYLRWFDSWVLTLR